MKYISINDLNEIIKENLSKIPEDIDLIVANPRSGFLPAIIISLIKNLPICDIESLAQNKIYSYGKTKKTNFINNVCDARKILVVEDSSYSGESIRLIREKIPSTLKDKCVLLVIFTNDKTMDLADICFEIINENRIFEWNLFHHKYLNYAALDLNVMYKNGVFKIKPSQKIDAVIIDYNLNKNEIVKKLNNNGIKHNRVIYPNEIDKKIYFIISDNVEKYKNCNVDIIEYGNRFN